MDRILIVDDDQSMRYSLTRMLEGQGFLVSPAKNGTEALERFEQEKPDLVIMDIKMPGQSGLEVLREIKERDPKALVILMTAFGTTETAIEAMKFGAFDYILKPFDIPQMRGLVERALEVSRMMKKMVSLPDREEGESSGGDHRRLLPGHAADLQDDRAGGPHGCHRSPPGGERDREGAGGPGHLPSQSAGRTSLSCR